MSTQRHTDTHTRTYWHATVTVSHADADAARAAEGWHTVEHYRCSHDHASRDSADRCAERARGPLDVGRIPKGWTR